MKTILLPLNLNANTMRIFQYAEPIAREMKACLVLLHVVRKQSYDNGTFSPDTDVHHRVTQEARIILEQLSRMATCSGIHARVVVRDGGEADSILETAQECKADMILLSSSSREEAEIGERVTRTANCSVLKWKGGSQTRFIPQPRVDVFFDEENYCPVQLAAA